MTISSWLTSLFNFIAELVQSDIFLFIVLAIAMLGLYGVIQIVFQIISFLRGR